MESNSQKRPFIEKDDNPIFFNKRKKVESVGLKVNTNKQENQTHIDIERYKSSLEAFQLQLDNEVLHNLKTATESSESLKLEYAKLKAIPTIFQNPKKWQKKYDNRLERYTQKIDKLRKTHDELSKKVCSELINLKNKKEVFKRSINKINRLPKDIGTLVQDLIKIQSQTEKFRDEEVTKRIDKLDIGKSVKRQTVRGDEYQRILQVLIRQRGLTKLCDPGVEVGIEVSGVGKVDDAVLVNTHDKKCRFFQMKYTASKDKNFLNTKILFKIPENEESDSTVTEIIDQQQQKKSKLDLHLLYYFQTFCEIKESEKFENYTIEEITFITNRELKLEPEEKRNSLLKKLKLETDEILFFEGVKATKYGLDVDKVFEKYSETLLNLSKRYLKCKRESAKEIIKEFLQKVCIVVSYLDLDKLKQLTFCEVFQENVFVSLSKEILGMWILYIEIKLLQIDKEYLANEKWKAEIEKLKLFIQGLRATAISKVNAQRIPSHASFNILFEMEAIRTMKEDVQELLKGNKYNVLNFFNKEQNMKLTFVTVIRILQELNEEENLLFCDYEDLVLESSFFDALTNDKLSLLIVMCKRGSCLEVTEDMKTKLQRALDSSKKIIVISEDSNSLITKLKELAKERYLERRYQHKFTDLSQCSKNKILEMKLTFQHKPITLSQLINEDIAKNAIDGNCIWELVEKKETNFELKSCDDSFCSSGYNKRYYISRKFYQTFVGYEDIKCFSNTNLVFVIREHGMEKSEVLKVLTEKGLQVQVLQWPYNKIPQKGLFLYEPTSDLINYDLFDSIVKKSSNACWVIMNKKKELLVTGQESNQKTLKPTGILNLPKKLYIKEETIDLGNTVILVGASGIGKSTTLTSIANRIRELHPCTWVAKVNLRKTFLFKTLNDLSYCKLATILIDSVINMVLLNNSYSPFEINLLKEGLNTKYKGVFRFVLLLDGYNEIKESSQKKVVVLIQKIRQYCNVEQIWITTQNQDQFTLESLLGVAAYVLAPLESSDQTNLMVQYWKCKYSQQIPPNISSEDELIKDAQSAINQWKNAIGDTEEKTFTENALNLTMLADILMFTERKISSNMNLLDLYDIFVQKKFSVYRKESFPTSSNYEDTKCIETAKEKLFENYVRETLQELSVKHICNKYKNSKRKGYLEKLSRMNTYKKFQSYVGVKESKLTLTKLGLLTFTNENELDFIHFSFAQYFFSEYLMQNINELNPELKKFFVQFIWCTSSLQPCRKFLNKALMKLELASVKKTNQNVAENSETNKNKISKECVNILLQKTRNSTIPISENLHYLVKFFLSWLNETDYKKYLDKILKADLVNFTSNKGTIESIVQKLPSFTRAKSSDIIIKLLRCKSDHSKLYSEVLSDLV